MSDASNIVKQINKLQYEMLQMDISNRSMGQVTHSILNKINELGMIYNLDEEVVTVNKKDYIKVTVNIMNDNGQSYSSISYIDFKKSKKSPFLAKNIAICGIFVAF